MLVASSRTATAPKTRAPAALATVSEAVVEVWPPELLTKPDDRLDGLTPVKDAEPPTMRVDAPMVTDTDAVPEAGAANAHSSTRTWFWGEVIAPTKLSGVPP